MTHPATDGPDERPEPSEPAEPPRTTPSWQPVGRTRAHELVIEAIEQQIVDGALVVGDALPPERLLAARLEVSRAGVREAIRVLEGQGVLRARVGSGREAGTFVAALPAAALTRFLRLHIALANFAMDDVVEARVLMERSSAALAAGTATAEALTRIRGPLEQMDAATDREAFNLADTAFHVAIAEAGGNRLVADMTTAIRDSLRGPIGQAIARVSDWPTLYADLCAQHHAIYRAIESGDPLAAADLTEAHIRAAYAALPLPPSVGARA